MKEGNGALDQRVEKDINFNGDDFTRIPNEARSNQLGGIEG